MVPFSSVLSCKQISNFSKTIYRRNYSFLIEYSQALCQIIHGIIFELLIVFSRSVCFFVWHASCTILFWLLSRCNIEIRNMMPSALFFLKIALSIWSLLWPYTNFSIVFSISVKNSIGILVGIALSLEITWAVWTFLY